MPGISELTIQQLKSPFLIHINGFTKRRECFYIQAGIARSLCTADNQIKNHASQSFSSDSRR